MDSADPFECWDATGLKKFLDIITAEALYPTEAIARQISSIYHSIDGHFRELEQLCELTDRVKLFQSVRSTVDYPFFHSII